MDYLLALSKIVLSHLLQFKKASITHDRHSVLSGAALAAQSATDRGDAISMYKLIRRLDDFKPMAFKGVLGKDGVAITDADLAKRRWQEHFT